MAFKYRLIRREIERVEIIRETKKFVHYKSLWTLQGVREAKRSGYQNYFDTFVEAKAFCVEQARENLKLYQRRLDHARSELQLAEALKETTNDQ